MADLTTGSKTTEGTGASVKPLMSTSRAVGRRAEGLRESMIYPDLGGLATEIRVEQGLA